MLPQRSCDVCVKRKRKCDLKQPCSFCSSRKVKCIYSKQEQLESQYKLLEERIRKLELLLILPFRNSWECSGQNPNRSIPVFQLPESVEKELFEKDHDNLLRLRISRYPITYFYTTLEFLVLSSRQSPPLKYALYATGSLFLTDKTLIPSFLKDRVELANVFLEKAKTFNFYEKNDPLNVLALSEIVLTLIQLNRVEEARLYIKKAFMYANFIGMTNEFTLMGLSSFDYEKENIRGIWWNIYSLAIFLGVGCDFKFDLYLPSNFLFESGTTQDELGPQLLNSDEWYTCSIPNQSFSAQRLILKKIQGKIMKYNNMIMLGTAKDDQYIVGCIAASLDEWIIHTKGLFQKHINLLIQRNVEKPYLTWYVIYTNLAFNFLRIELVMAKFIRKILEGKNAFEILHVGEALSAALNNGNILQLIQYFNPTFDHLIGYIGVMMFPTAFFLQCMVKIPALKSGIEVEKVKCAYKTHLDLFFLYESAFQREATYVQLLKRMEDLDLYNSILTFGQLKSFGNELAVQRPKAQHVDVFATSL